MDNYKGKYTVGSKKNSLNLEALDDDKIAAGGYGALAQRGEMTNAERAALVAEFELGMEEKRRNMTKGQRLTHDKKLKVFKEELTKVTDASAIKIHGLNSELKLVRSKILAADDPKTPMKPEDLEAFKNREQELLEKVFSVITQTQDHLEQKSEYKQLTKPKNPGLRDAFDEYAWTGKGYVDFK